MPLAQPLLVGAENQRHVRELRHRRAQRLVKQHLLRRVRDVIVAPHHMRDLHLDIVGDDGEVIRGMAVGSEDDEVLDVRVVELRSARARDRRNGVCPSGTRKRIARGRCSRSRFGDLVGGQRAAGAVVASRRRRSASARLALGFQFFGRAVAAIRRARRRRAARASGAIAVEPFGLEVRARAGRPPPGLRPTRARATAGRRECPRPCRPTSARRRYLRCAGRTRRRAAARRAS